MMRSTVAIIRSPAVKRSPSRIGLVAERIGEALQAALGELNRAGAAKLCPFLILVEKSMRATSMTKGSIELSAAISHCVARARALCVLRQQRLAALADVQDDRAGFEQH